MEKDELLQKRFIELARRSENSAYFTFTDFLGLSELSLFESIKGEIKGIHYDAFGGAEGAERLIIRFGNPDELGYDEPFPITILKIKPLSEKFAEKLGHRDFLGSLLALGIERDKLGDICVRESCAYLFVHSSEIDRFIISELKKVRRTAVSVTYAEALPEGELYKTERRKIQLSSERLDAVVAKIFSLSRDEAQLLFKRGMVFVSGRVCDSQAYTPKRGEIISVRGHGRFRYLSYETLSKKGKYNAELELYI